MLYIQWNPDPILIDLGFIALRWYSILFAFGIFLAYWLVKKQTKNGLLSLQQLDKLTIYIIVGTVVGARLGHCLFYEFNYYIQHPLEMLLPFRFQPEFKFTGFQGLASHGGAIGIFIGLVLFVRKYKVNFWSLLDLLAGVIPLTAASIRLGNLMNSEIVGKPSDINWAFVFERVDLIPRHPGQLYEALGYILVFLLLRLTSIKMPLRKSGVHFGLFLALMFVVRFFVEYVKADQVDFESGMLLNMGQWLSIPFVLVGVAIMAYRSKKQS